MTDKTPNQTLRIKDIHVLLLLALCGVVIHTLLNGQYGFHRDELDIIMNARRLDWGYVAYPPFAPFMARLGLELFGTSLRGLRFFSAVAQGIVVLLVGLMARDMGGKRSTQIMAAIAVFIAPVALMSGTLIQYMAFDYLWWVVVAFFVVRLLTTQNPRYWLGIGAAVGFGLITKYTIAFWVASLGIAVITTSMRKQLGSKWLWLGIALTLLICLPNFIWQIQHDFITLNFLKFIHARDIQWGRTDDFLSDQLFTTTNPFTLPIWIIGLGALIFSPTLKRYRSLAWMFLVTFTLFHITRGRAYYTGPAYVVLLVAGIVWLKNWLNGKSRKITRIGTSLLWGLLSLGAIIGLVLIKPIATINSPLWKITSDINGEVNEMIGWQDLTAQVASIYQSIPDNEKPHTVILAGNYGEAGALEMYGSEYGLPPVISGSNSMWARGFGKVEPQTVIVVGFEKDYAGNYFKECDVVDTVKNQYGVNNEETTYHTGLYICRQPRFPWKDMWSSMQWFQ